MALGARITTTTNQKLMPYVVDTILNSNVAFQRIVNASKEFQGEKLLFPIKYSINSTFQTFAAFDTFSTSATNNRVNMTYYPAFAQITSALPGDELSTNKAAGDQKIMDLVGVTLKSDSQDLADQLGTLFYSSTGAGTDPLGLAAIVDDGTTVATIGGLSRTTYPTLAGTVTASGGTLTLAKMGTLWNAVTSGAQQPTTIWTTKTVYNLYEQLLAPQERIIKNVPFTKGVVSGDGFTGLSYKGVAVLQDEKATSGVLFYINEDYLDFYAMPHWSAEAVNYRANIKGNDYETPLGLGFSWSGWIKVSNSDSVVGHTYFGGQFTTDDPKRMGKLTGITSV